MKFPETDRGQLFVVSWHCNDLVMSISHVVVVFGPTALIENSALLDPSSPPGVVVVFVGLCYPLVDRTL